MSQEEQSTLDEELSELLDLTWTDDPDLETQTDQTDNSSSCKRANPDSTNSSEELHEHLIS